MDYFAQASSDNIRLAKSRYILAPDDGTHNVIRMPRFAFLIDVFFQLITPYSGASSGLITLGLIGNGAVADPDAVLVDVYIGSETAGMSRMSGGSAVAAEGYWFDDASGVVTLTSTLGNSSATIACQVFAFYTIIH